MTSPRGGARRIAFEVTVTPGRYKPPRHLRGRGSAAVKARQKHHRGLDRAGHFKSKAQHRWAFATHQTWARRAAVRGRYKTLPPRVARPTARTAR